MGFEGLMVLICTALSIGYIEGAFGSSDKVLLSDIKVLTLNHGQSTAYRRSSPVPQLKCVGGSAGCTSFTPRRVQCYNRGSDGIDIQWECKTDMDNAYRFGTVEVTCEGYDYPDDPYVLKGSCGLEYTLDLTEEGHQRKYGGHHDYGYQHHHSNHYPHNYDNDYHDRSRNHYSSGQKFKTKATSVIGDLILLGIIGVIVYALYKTCIASNNPGSSEDDHSNQRRHDNYADPPPPYGFRSDYMNNDGPSCSSSYNRHNTYTGSPTGGSTGGGFWSGAMTGGILGYMFGNRNSNYYGSRTYTSPFSNSWWGSRSYGSRTYSSPSYSSGSGGSMFSGSSSSSGSRTASGFGGTKRR